MKLTKNGMIDLFMVCLNVGALSFVSGMYQGRADLTVDLIAALTAFTMFLIDAAWINGAYHD